MRRYGNGLRLRFGREMPTFRRSRVVLTLDMDTLE